MIAPLEEVGAATTRLFQPSCNRRRKPPWRCSWYPNRFVCKGSCEEKSFAAWSTHCVVCTTTSAFANGHGISCLQDKVQQRNKHENKMDRRGFTAISCYRVSTACSNLCNVHLAGCIMKPAVGAVEIPELRDARVCAPLHLTQRKSPSGTQPDSEISVLSDCCHTSKAVS